LQFFEISKEPEHNSVDAAFGFAARVAVLLFFFLNSAHVSILVKPAAPWMFEGLEISVPPPFHCHLLCFYKAPDSMY